MGLIRLFLAYVVVCDHWRAIVAPPVDLAPSNLLSLRFNAGYAVMFFYMISGFLITYTLRKNYGPGDTARFYRNRFIRIFSLYWPMVAIVFIGIPGALGTFLDAGLVDKATALFLFGQDWRVSFGAAGGAYFGGNITFLNQSWTLGAELTFYLFAPLLVRFPKAAIALLCASLAVRAAFVAALGGNLHVVWTYTFFPSTACFFLLGYAAALATGKLPAIDRPAVGYGAMAVIVLVMAFMPSVAFDTARFWICVSLFAIGLPGIFAATRDIRILNMLGDLSYPLYLIHILVMVLVSPWLVSFGGMSSKVGNILTMEAFAALALVAAALVHLVEIAASRLMHAAADVFARRARSPAPPVTGVQSP